MFVANIFNLNKNISISNNFINGKNYLREHKR